MLVVLLRHHMEDCRRMPQVLKLYADGRVTERIIEVHSWCGIVVHVCTCVRVFISSVVNFHPTVLNFLLYVCDITEFWFLNEACRRDLTVFTGGYVQNYPVMSYGAAVMTAPGNGECMPLYTQPSIHMLYTPTSINVNS